MLRTHTCGELNEKHTGKKVTLYGWIDGLRDHGGLKFIDLRDRYGVTQVVPSKELQAAIDKGTYKSEHCVQITGEVKPRPAGTENAKLPTGKIEVVEARVPETEDGFFHSPAKPLPFEIGRSRETNEELRLKYRFLDLRNPDVSKNFVARHRANQIIRRVLDEARFIEVDTPILTKSTPEGARDYLVPSRLNVGEFFALPQSPQLFKQILMVAGLDRYFQIAKCFRDEDLRSDRQPEFTQLDMEMSFLDEEDIFTHVEAVLKALFKEIASVDLKTPLPRFSHEEVMNRYGTDKPDLRFGLPIEDVSGCFKDTKFKVFKDALGKPDGRVVCLVLPKGAALSRKDIDHLIEQAKTFGALGLAWFKVEKGKLESSIAKFFDEASQKSLITASKAAEGDLILLAADKRAAALRILGEMRLYLGRSRKLIPEKEFRLCWVTDFPLFKYNEEEKRWESEHHPFTSPNPKDWKTHKASGKLGSVRSRAYDLVLNGVEVASGSVRIHKKDVQKEIFKIIGLEQKEAERRFGFLLRALDYGAPPHGGIALGIDRVLALLLGLESIRDVIAFPKNQKAVCPLTEAPSPVGDRQLKELGIKIR